MGTVSEVIDDCHVLMDRGHRVSLQKRVLFWGNKELICPGLGWVSVRSRMVRLCKHSRLNSEAECGSEGSGGTACNRRG